MEIAKLDNEQFYTLFNRIEEKLYQMRNLKKWSWYRSRLSLVFGRMQMDNARRMKESWNETGRS